MTIRGIGTAQAQAAGRAIAGTLTDPITEELMIEAADIYRNTYRENRETGGMTANEAKGYALAHATEQARPG